MHELSISGTVSFKETCKDRWQTVYSSSLYGTMFSIFGKFDYSSNDKTLKDITLRLVNYKGPIYLAIKEVKFQKARKWVEIKDKLDNNNIKIVRVISLLVNLRGLIPSVDIQPDPKEEYVLTECDFENDVYLEIDRTLSKLNSGGNHKEKWVFDSEFYYRDGLRDPNEFDRTYREARDLNPTVNTECVEDRNEEGVVTARRIVVLEEKENNGKNEKDKNQITDKSPGAVCPKGYSKIIF